MAIESGKSTAVQGDYSKFRRPPEKEDLELSAEGQALLVPIDESARPKELPTLFPRIVNRMARLWKTPRQMDRYFEDLLTDNRGNRHGFPLAVLMELSTLKDYYQARVFPMRRDVWDS